MEGDPLGVVADAADGCRALFRPLLFLRGPLFLSRPFVGLGGRPSHALFESSGYELVQILAKEPRERLDESVVIEKAWINVRRVKLPAARKPHVVHGLLFWVSQDFVREIRKLESLFNVLVARMLVGMLFQNALSIGLLYLARISTALDPKNLVVTFHGLTLDLAIARGQASSAHALIGPSGAAVGRALCALEAAGEAALRFELCDLHLCCGQF